jgi:hypothetical protein
MYYVIQENLFKEYHFNTLREYLERYKLGYEVVKYVPFVHEIQHKTDRKDVWCFGSVNMAFAAKKYNWSPGSMYNENHDVNVYGKHYGDNMLNSDGIILKVGEPLPESLPYAFFARPTHDTKSFSGQCFTKDSWKEWIDKVVQDEEVFRLLSKETEIVVAPLKTIQQEIRCWIVNGKPVTISQYKIGSRVNYLNMDHNEEAVIFATQMAKLYCPADAFVLDICLYNDDYKVVEINCINCSGFYDGNMSKLIQALEAKFGNNE